MLCQVVFVLYLVLPMSETETNTTPTPVPATPGPAQKEGSFWDLLKFALITLLIVLPIRLFIAQPFVVSGSSMFPTFHDADYLIVDELSYLVGDPKRDDVVIFKYPYDQRKYFIKRVIGLPGETVEVDDGVVTIFNDEHLEGLVLEEPYVAKPYDSDKRMTLKDDEYFVMGDNRGASSDSRAWGPVHRNFMVGRAFLRLFPASSIGLLPGDYKQNKN